MHVCNPSVCTVEAGGSGVQGQPGLYQAMSTEGGEQSAEDKEEADVRLKKEE